MIITRFNKSIFLLDKSESEVLVNYKIAYINPVSEDTNFEYGLSNAYVENIEGYGKYIKSKKLKLGDIDIYNSGSDYLPENIDLLTIVTKKEGKSILDKDNLKKVLINLKSKMLTLENDVFVTPLIGCGIGQSTFTSAYDLFKEVFKDFKKPIIVSVSPLMKPEDFHLPVLFIETDRTIDFSKKDIKAFLKMHFKQNKEIVSFSFEKNDKTLRDSCKKKEVTVERLPFTYNEFVQEPFVANIFESYPEALFFHNKKNKELENKIHKLINHNKIGILKLVNVTG